VGGGQGNNVCKDYSLIVGGLNNFNNVIYGGILGGICNTLSNYNNYSHIVGSCITADRECTTFVNNLSIKNIPTSAAGLPSGSVWRCTTDNTLRIVP
jgi:hypothetical protein